MAITVGRGYMFRYLKINISKSDKMEIGRQSRIYRSIKSSFQNEVKTTFGPKTDKLERERETGGESS